MSKHMQIRVTINPYYEKNLEGSYPGLGRQLRLHEPDLASRNPSLYELAGQMDTLLYHLDGTPLREVLLKHKDTLTGTYKQIQENIADWNLPGADKLLYRIEDIFDRIESDLDQ